MYQSLFSTNRFILYASCLFLLLLMQSKQLAAIDTLEFTGLFERVEQADDKGKIKIYKELSEKFNDYRLDTLFNNLYGYYQLHSSLNDSFHLYYTCYLASVLNANGYFTEACRFLDKWLIVAEKNNDTKELVEINNSYGHVYATNRLHEKAIDCYLFVLEHTNDPRKKSIAYINLGNIFADFKNYHKAKYYYNKSKEINQEYGQLELNANAWNNLGSIHEEMNEYDSSLICYKEAVRLFRVIQNISFLSVTLNNIGIINLEIGSYDSALFYLNESLKYYKFINEWEKDVKGRILSYLAKTHAKLGNMQQSKKYLIETINYTDSIFTNSYLSGLYENISDLFAYHNDYKSSLMYYKKYREIGDSLFTVEKSKQIQELEIKYQSEQQKQENEIQKLTIQSQQSEIRKQLTQKIAILGGLIMALVISALVYRSYRLKNKSNALLKKQKEQIEIMSEKIHQADRMKIDFFTNISHELRTPLSVITGLATEIEATNGNELLNPKIISIKRNGVKLTGLVDQMLDLRKLDDGEMIVNLAEGNISAFVSRVILMLESLAAQKNIKIEYETGKDKVTGCFDPDKLEKITVNLLSNAIKYSRSGSVVHVKMERDENNTGFVKLSIEDTGAGIPPEEVEYIFKPFFQASNSNYGSGIGLALTKEMTELMNGTITVESRENVGTCFMVRLPVKQENFRDDAKCRKIEMKDFNEGDGAYIEMLLEESRWENEPAQEYIAMEAKEKDAPILLIVEDNKDLSDFITGIFKKEYNIYTARNGKKGLEIALDKLPDLVISDVMMPEMDGFEMCRRIKTDERTSHIPVILLTAKTGEENLIAGLEQGADDYMVKPFSGKELLARVKNMVIQRQKLREKFSKELDTVEPEAITVSPMDEAFLKKAMAIVEQSMNDPDFDIGVFVKKMGMSRANLHIKLKNLTGQSASRFVESMRLRVAARLLNEKNKNISEIAYEVGFSDSAYFSRQFKKAFNKTPKEYCNS